MPFQEHGFTSANLSSCDELEEVRFFAGMFSPENMPLKKIDAALRSITSQKMETIVLDLNTNHIPQRINRQVAYGLECLDQQLCRIASQSPNYASQQLTVKLSAYNPYSFGRHFRRFRRLGRLIVGTRYRDSDVCICGELCWIGDYQSL